MSNSISPNKSSSILSFAQKKKKKKGIIAILLNSLSPISDFLLSYKSQAFINHPCCFAR